MSMCMTSSESGFVKREGFLSFSPPSIGDEEIAEVVDTLRSNWISRGPKTRAFEIEMARYIGASDSLALNSCTAALHLALATSGLGPGDEVITTPITFAASVNVIEHVGARPILVDVEPDTLNIDPACVEAAITGRTRAILPVHFAGHPAEIDPLLAIAAARRLVVVEDAAHALAALYRGRMIGSGENPTAFSFYATKNLTTGEGGLLTGDVRMLESARVMSQHGMSRDAWSRYDEAGDWFYEVTVPGFKYNMSDLQASIGLQQLRKLRAFQDRRRAIASEYSRAFSGEEALEVPAERDYVTHAWHLYVLRLREGCLRINRGRFIDELKSRNIGTSVHFIPMNAHPYYRDRYGWRPSDTPLACSNYERALSLPLHPGMSLRDVSDVVDAVLDVVRCNRG